MNDNYTLYASTALDREVICIVNRIDATPLESDLAARLEKALNRLETYASVVSKMDDVAGDARSLAHRLKELEENFDD
jgi:hypothetical protein